MSAGQRGAAGGGWRGPARPTIRDVARRAGVSIGTVSNVLTGRRAVSPAARSAVEGAVAALGYVPDLSARTLISRRGRAAPSAPADAPRLWCVGYVCADYVSRLGALPHRGDRVAARGIDKTLGGRAANVAVAAAGLGAPLETAVELLTVLGEDPDSDWAAAMLAARRVALAPESVAPGARLSRCLILLEDDGARTIVNEPLQVGPRAAAALLERAAAHPGARRALFVQGDQAAALEGVVAEARAAGLPAVSQIGGAEAAADPEGWRRRLRLFDVALLNREAAETLWGVGGGEQGLLARVAAAPRAALTVLTLGAEGAALFDGDAAPLRAAAPSATVADATGAGDAFAGVFLAAWLAGATLETALALAARAGARAVSCVGAQEHGLTCETLLLNDLNVSIASEAGPH